MVNKMLSLVPGMSQPRPRPGRAGLRWAVGASLAVHVAWLLAWHSGSSNEPLQFPGEAVLKARWVFAGPVHSPPREEALALPSSSEPTVPALSPTTRRSKALISRPSSPALTEAALPVAARVSDLEEALAPSSVPPPVSAPNVRSALPPAPDYLAAAHLSQSPAPLGEVELHYPDEADRQQGRVVLRLLINEQGALDDVGVVDAFPPGLFEKAAISDFGKAVFSPGQQGGRAVKSQITIEVAYIPFNRGAVSGQSY